MIKIYKNIIKKLTLGIVILMSINSCDEDDNKYPQLGNDPRTIAEIATDTPELSTLAGALSRVGLDVTLNTTTTYTVIAPNNGAFTGVDLNSLSDEQLEQILLNHVISTTTPGFSASLESGYILSMSEGPDDTNLSLYIDNSDKLTFNGVATVVAGKFDIGATNGVVHIVDGVLHPPTVTDHIKANPNFSSLAQVIELTGLEDELGGESINTVFAPTNAAFEAFLTDVNGAFGWTTLEEIPVDVLTNVILYHITADNNISEDIDGTTFDSALVIEDVSQTFSVSGTQIDDASYTNANLGADVNIQGVNGVLHSVDKVLLHDNVFQSILAQNLNIPERAEDRGFTSFLEAAAMVDLSVDFTADNADLTILVPNNDAFVGLFAIADNFGNLADFDTPEDLELLKDLLEYHLINGITLLGSITDGQTITTIYGDDVTANLSGDDPRLVPSFEEAISSIIVNPNIGASNGVLHELNRVLVPEALVSALGIETSSGGIHPVTNEDWVFFDWDGKDPYWGNVEAENEAALSLDGSNYGRINMPTGTTAWVDLFWRNGNTLNGGAEIGTNINDYSLKFDINVLEPINEGMFRIRFNDADGVDAFYNWQPWVDSGEPYSTDGWITVEIPLSVLGVPDFSLIDQEFGMAFEGADILLNFAIDNVRFDTPGNGGPDPVADTDLVFFDYDGKDPYWGNVEAENDVALSLDGSNYGRINMQTETIAWVDLLWRNGNTLNGGNVVGSNVSDYSLKFDINVLEPINAGMFRIRFNDSDGVDAFYNWQPWVDSGDPYSTDGWTTVTIPCSVLGVPDFSLIDAEFGMAFEGADILLNFAIDNVRFEAN